MQYESNPANGFRDIVRKRNTDAQPDMVMTISLAPTLWAEDENGPASQPCFVRHWVSVLCCVVRDAASAATTVPGYGARRQLPVLGNDLPTTLVAALRKKAQV